MLQRLKNNRLFWLVRRMVGRYIVDEVSLSGAQLAYFLLFSLFPLLLFVNALIGVLHIDSTDLFNAAETVLPTDVLGIVEGYLDYLSGLSTPGMLFTGLGLTLFSSTKAVNTLLHALNVAYDVPERRNFPVQAAISALFSALLLVSLVVILFLLIAGRSAMSALSNWWTLPLDLVNLWLGLRFVLLTLWALGLLTLLYVIAPNKRICIRCALPGAFFASLAWLGVSMGLSYYVENIAQYSLIYGSLGAIIVLMTWLYMTGVILLLGGMLNHALEDLRDGKNKERHHA